MPLKSNPTPTPVEIAHYNQLLGGKIEKIEWEGSSEFTPILIVRMPDQTTLAAIVQSDPEGNGPGFLDICNQEDA